VDDSDRPRVIGFYAYCLDAAQFADDFLGSVCY
jgi:hypothetical protein